MELNNNFSQKNSNNNKVFQSSSLGGVAKNATAIFQDNYNFERHMKYEEIDAKQNSGTNFAYKNLETELNKECLATLWNFAFETVEVDHMFGGGFSEETLRSFWVKELVSKAYNGQEAISLLGYKEDKKELENAKLDIHG